MQVELKELQRSLGITFIFVTHDQEEALTLSDRIAVFNNGTVVQLGTPTEIYERPRTSFVASFVGTSNIFDESLSKSILGRAGTNSVRPERIALRENATATTSSAPGTIAELIYVGTATRIVVDLDVGKRIIVLEQNSTSEDSTAQSDRRGERVHAEWANAAIVPLDLP